MPLLQGRHRKREPAPASLPLLHPVPLQEVGGRPGAIGQGLHARTLALGPLLHHHLPHPPTLDPGLALHPERGSVPGVLKAAPPPRPLAPAPSPVPRFPAGTGSPTHSPGTALGPHQSPGLSLVPDLGPGPPPHWPTAGPRGGGTATAPTTSGTPGNERDNKI